MHTRSVTARLLLVLSLGVSGCANVTGGRPNVASNIRTVTSVGDKTLPTVSGTPGDTVVAGQAAPERRASRSSEGRISGRVFDGKGRPVPNAEVRLGIGGAARGKTVHALTDESGAFSLQGLRRGTPYTVVAERQVGRDLLTGSANAKAPSYDVRIRLAAEDAAPSGPRADATPDDAPGRVNRVSGRGRDDGESGDEPADDGDRPRVNEEDLPPVAEAAELDGPPPSRRVARAAETAPSTGWRRSGSTPTPPASDDPAATREDDGDPIPSTAQAADDPAPEPPQPRRATEPPPRRVPAPQAQPKPEPEPEPKPEPEPASTTEPAPPIEPRERAAAMPEAVAPLPDLVEAPPARASEPEPAPTVEAAEAKVDDPAPSQAPAGPPASADADPAPIDPKTDEPPPPAADLPDLNDATPPATARKPPPRPKRVTWGDLSTKPGAQFASLDTPPAKPKPKPRGIQEKPQADPVASGPVAGVKATCQFDSRRQQLLDFRLPDLQGRPVRFQDLDADLVLLDFWGTWCGPCVQAIPHLVELQERLGKTVKVVGIAYEEGKTPDRVAAVEAARRKLGIPYPLLLGGLDGDCPLQAALHVQAYPTMILLDREGHVLWRDQGAAAGTLARLDRVIDAKAKAVLARR